MNEGKLLFIAAIFLAAASVSMARLGAQSGGRPWAAGWFALYGAGFFATQAAQGVPLAMPASLALGILFSALLFRGASIYSGRFLDHVDSLIAITAGFIALRIASHYLWGAAVDQAFGTIANFIAVGLSCWALLSPAHGRLGVWNRVLAAGFIVIAFVESGYSWARIAGEPTLPWFTAWLVTGIVLSSLQTGAFVWAAEDHVLPLRDEANRNQLD